MRVRIAPGATEDEASAIATALATHLGDSVDVYVGDATEPAATHEYDPTDDTHSATANADGSTAQHATASSTESLGPTDRERALEAEIEDILEGGPKKYREGLDEKLFVRDRLELWFGGADDAFLFEDGTFAAFDDWHPDGAGEETDDRLPADGLITGGATFEGRDLHFMANDYTVKRGSMAAKGVDKFLQMQQRALKTGRPVLYLMDSSGGRIDQQTGFFANREGIGKYYYNHSMLSGRVPQICVLYGPCIAGAAYTPVFADFTIMVENMSAMAIASPRMVQMVTGEDISLEELGGPEVHARESGSADLVAKDENMPANSSRSC